MSILRVLLPELRRCAATPVVANGTLARWFARGDRRVANESGIEACLREIFDWPGRGVPIAALTRQYDNADAAGHAWLRADPAHVRADMTTARMLACGELGLDETECALLARDLKPLFGDSGFEFDASLPNRWYLRASLGAELPDAAPPDDAIGDDLKLHLPIGAAGRRWRMLFNETQVLLHNHAVNAARLERGAVSVNALWFWGAGALPLWVRSAATHVFTNGVALTGLASLAKASVHALDLESVRDTLARNVAGNALLIDLATLRGDALESGWLLAIDELLQQKRIGEIQLLLESGERISVRASHRLRFWRSMRALSA